MRLVFWWEMGSHESHGYSDSRRSPPVGPEDATVIVGLAAGLCFFQTARFWFARLRLACLAFELAEFTVRPIRVCARLKSPCSGLWGEFARMSKCAIYIELVELNVATPFRGDSGGFRRFSNPANQGIDNALSVCQS